MCKHRHEPQRPQPSVDNVLATTDTNFAGQHQWNLTAALLPSERSPHTTLVVARSISLEQQLQLDELDSNALAHRPPSLIT